MKQMKHTKISTKLAVILGAILLAVFVGLSIVVSRLSEDATSEAIHAELSNLAYTNGQQVQAILDRAQVQAAALEDYVLNAYDSNIPSVAPLDEAGQKSMVYDAQLSAAGLEKETYLAKNMWSSVLSNEDLVGLGVYFEPNQFDAAVKDYTLYVNKADALGKKVESDGAYSNYGEQDYYKPAKETQKPHFTDPYQEAGQEEGVIMITASYPIVYQNVFRGVVLADINIWRFSKIAQSSERYKTLSVSILTDDFNIVYDSQAGDAVGRNLAEFGKDSAQMEKIKDAAAAGQAFFCNTLRADGQAVSRFFCPIQVGDRIWWAQSAVDTADLTKDARSLTVTIVSLSILSLIVLVAIVAMVVKKQLKPIHAVVSAAASIAEGDLGINLQIKSRDEIGMLAQTFMGMADHLKTIIGDIGHLLGEMADGNFRVDTEHEDKYIGEYREILLAMRGISGSLSDTLADINMASAQVSSGADQIAGGAQILSQGATEQASAVEQLTATIAGISTRIKENAESAQHANLLSEQSQREIVESDEHMRQLMIAMEEMSATSNEIKNIIKTIEDIAFQTNILSLNAAVEAARAGSVGKGFAVVADEVRRLAVRSAEAAHDTTELITSTLSAIKNGKAFADQTAASLRDVVDKSETVHEKIQQIAMASEEQSTAVRQLAMGIEQVSAVVQTNSSTAEESAAASEELSGQAHMLRGAVHKFRLRDSDESTDAYEIQPINRKGIAVGSLRLLK